MCRSVLQIVDLLMQTIPAVGVSIVGSGTSSHAFWPGL
jgi:hypothetical protein